MQFFTMGKLNYGQSGSKWSPQVSLENLGTDYSELLRVEGFNWIKAPATQVGDGL
jgi:hypothetical protein